MRLPRVEGPIPPRAARAAGALGAATVVGLGVSVLLGQLEAGQAAVLLFLGAAGGIGLATLAITRFETFVLAVLALRASLDWAKPATRSLVGLQPAAALGILFTVAGVLWLGGRRRARGREVERSSLTGAVVVFLAAALASVPLSGGPASSLLEFARIAAAVVMLVVLERMLVRPEQVQRLLTVVFLSALVPLAVATFQMIRHTGLFVRADFSRVTGTFLHPTSFAAYLALLIIMGAALLPHLERRFRLPMLGLLGACSVFLLLTYTRGAWIAALAGVVVVGMLQDRRLAATALAAAVIAIYMVPSVSARFTDLERASHPRSGTPNNSLVWRVGYWTEALQLANRNPVTGIGLKQVELLTEEEKTPHNDFVRAYVEMGAVGLLAYLGLIAALVMAARRALARARAGWPRAVAAGFAGCMAAFLLQSLIGNLLSQVVILWYLFAFAAAALASSRFRGPEGARAGRIT
ncbi:MAG: O-antigen ligase family protein [Actinomycetota bacterium]